MTSPTLPRLLMTSGEPAGIGPDVCLQVAMQSWPCALAVTADLELMQQRADALGLSVVLRPWQPGDALPEHQPGSLWVKHLPVQQPVSAGQLHPANAQYVLDMLRYAANACLANQFDAMVTAPVHKGVINDAGIAFSGHTEFLEALTGTKKVVMMLATGQLRVALATTHLPLQRVASAITPPLLDAVIRVLHQDLISKFGIATPRILVCGLNPHAGEGGHLGREEINVIEPALKALRQAGMDLIGPLPADTLFTPKYLQQADAVLAMYHDQGLPVLKYVGFGNAVNVTLGLPIIRTSVDHGTALDLAATGQADVGSLAAAVGMALDMVRARAVAAATEASAP